MTSTNLEYLQQITAASLEYLHTRRAGAKPNIFDIVHRHVQHPNRNVRRVGYRQATRTLTDLARQLDTTHLRGYDLHATIDQCIATLNTNVSVAELIESAFAPVTATTTPREPLISGKTETPGTHPHPPHTRGASE